MNPNAVLPQLEVSIPDPRRKAFFRTTASAVNSPYLNKKFIVDTNQAPRAIGPYSQAVGYGGLLFVSGQIPINPDTGELVTGGVEAQTRRVMNNLQAVLMAAGLDFSHVLKTTIYLRNMNDYQLVNDVYALYFDHSPPARVAVEVSRLPKDVLVEIDAIAAAPTDYAARVEEPEPDTPVTHPGPDEWEAQHKQEAQGVHDTMLGEPPSVDDEPENGPALEASSEEAPASENNEPVDEDEPPASASGERPTHATQELTVDDLQEAAAPPPLAGLKIPRPKTDKKE